MQSRDEKSDSLFSYADLEARVPQDIPLRAIREQKHDMLIVIDDRLQAVLHHARGHDPPLPGHSPGSLARHGA